MSGRENRKFPKVGVFLVVISCSGKWLLDIRQQEPVLPFKELSGGESWEGALGLVKQGLGLEDKEHSLAGIGSGIAKDQESWVYCVFKSEEVNEVSLQGYKWIQPEKDNSTRFLDCKIKQAFLGSPKQIWED